MTTFEAGNVTLQKVREYVWEIQPSDGMRVPARVLASEALLEEIANDKTLQQLQNTAHLPGIRKYALCMPDGHQGYGFPVGGVAGIDATDGCISPGAVGYDINCLPYDTSVRLPFGRRMSLRDLRDRFESEPVLAAGHDTVEASNVRFFMDSGTQTVYELTTETGQSVTATADHPIATPEGMVSLDDIEVGDCVFVYPFDGFKHHDPPEFRLLSGDDVSAEAPQTVDTLDASGLLPLMSTDEAVNRLLRLAGYHRVRGEFTDGHTRFYAASDDITAIQADITALGFGHDVQITDAQPPNCAATSPPHVDCCLTVTTPAFTTLIKHLRHPETTADETAHPGARWFQRLADWQQALYISGLFGGGSPAPTSKGATMIAGPTLTLPLSYSDVTHRDEVLPWLHDALNCLGIETVRHDVSGPDIDPEGQQSLTVAMDTDNLISFFSRIEYAYSTEKREAAAIAVQYLRTKQHCTAPQRSRPMANPTRTDGGPLAQTPRPAPQEATHDSRRDHWCDSSDQSHSREPIPSFHEYRESTPITPNLTVPTTITSITPTESRPVCDIGVAHPRHNFIANGIVVSNCGVRMVRTNLEYRDVTGHEEELVDKLFEAIPSGLGGGGVVESDRATIEAALERGVDWALEEGFATEHDLAHCEDEGMRSEADASTVSQKAKDRGKNQMGSLGSGNHFLEVQRVTDIFDTSIADAYGLWEDEIVVLIHCGSRGLGHQVCTDYLRDIEQTHSGLLSQLPDKELAAAPADSQLAEDYYQAMCAAINFAWVNRQLITHQTREVFADVFDESWEALGMDVLYDVAHNIAKKEIHDVPVDTAASTARDVDPRSSEHEERELYVHRKGATRAFPAGRPEVPRAYRDVGQPVIIPGSMGAGSYILCGGQESMQETFGSTAHGAGRLMSRTQAKNEFWGGDVRDDLRSQQVYVKAQSGATIAEEAPGVYKDVDEVVRVSDELGIGDKVARVYPVCNIKG